MANTVVARTTISGLINGEVFEGTILASFDPDGGGKSRCEFSQLPREFNPATLGTHT